jgi:hypothetical protein
MSRSGRMPVPCKEDRYVRLSKFFDVFVENRHYPIAVLHPKSAAGAKIILHVNNHQCFLRFHRFLFIIENDTVVAIESVEQMDR